MTLLKSEKGEKSTVKIEFSIDKATFDAAVEKGYRFFSFGDAMLIE